MTDKEKRELMCNLNSLELHEILYVAVGRFGAYAQDLLERYCPEKVILAKDLLIICQDIEMVKSRI